MELTKGWKGWIVVVSAGVSALSVGVASLSYWSNRADERERWQSRLSAKLTFENVEIGRALPTGETDLLFVAPREPGEYRVYVAAEGKEASAVVSVVGPGEERMISILLKNSSFRPTAIVAVTMRDGAGKEVRYRTPGYTGRAGLPAVIDPWRVAHLKVPVIPGAQVLVLRDSDDREAHVPIDGSSPSGSQWISFQ